MRPKSSQVKNVSKMPGTIGPPGSQGPAGRNGSSYFSACQFKTKSESKTPGANKMIVHLNEPPVVGCTMPPKKHKKFNVGRYMKIRKEEQDRILKKNTKLLNCIESEERTLKTQRMKLSRLQSKVKKVKGNCDMLSQGLEHREQQFSAKRTRRPTILCDSKSNLGPGVAAKRRNETLNAAAMIHGGTEANKIPALDGMFDTLNKKCKLSDLANYISNVDNLQERVVSDAYSKSVQSL
ncbi:hypothetical protein AWC38_SpisGene18103 [Stylophora pistillata]|uniref:Uncharacterized protein n=1 Tax=Stylophora pistillata TaxID=50429 RepID=A0A2B4RK60_STYPI|nr:hypothetical protein AWC38_SpisGene18103 [Stylophora pistillata]